MNIRILLFLLSVFYEPIVPALPVKDLYRASIKLPVMDSEEQMLNDAFSQAVEQVLIKVSGNKDAITGDLLKEADKDVSTWVEQYSVVFFNDLIPINGFLVSGKQVNVVFYHESIDQFLTQYNLSVWGNNRPPVLVWVVGENNGTRTLLGANTPSEILNDLEASAIKLGIPIYVPLMDSVDSSAISPSDVWGFFENKIKSASQRYQTDVLAALRVIQYDGLITCNLLVMTGVDSQRFLLSGDNLQELVDQVSTYIAKTLSDRYAAVKNSKSKNRFKIHVSHVSSYLVMHKVQKYLKNIGVVRDVYVVNITNGSVTFSVTIDGDKKKLMDSILLSSLLEIDNMNQNNQLNRMKVTSDNTIQSEVFVPTIGVAISTNSVNASRQIQTSVKNNIEYFRYSGI